ncbi:MAG: carbohydrate porin [Planctomycetes bacterium]|nr:carbohydrate porin [Planctomycetota bacterium]
MTRWNSACLAAFVLVGVEMSVARAQSPTKPEESKPSQKARPSDEAAPKSGDAKKPMPSLIEKLPDYSGDLSHRSFLLGDWGGKRTELAEKGILFDLGVTQGVQGNAHGGKNTKDAVEYEGSYDLTLKFDTARMGLWPGGLLTLRGETWFGNDMHRHVGSIMAVNADDLFPVPGDSGETTLSEFYFAQALSEKFVLVMGKMDLSKSMDQNAFACNEKTQFMNFGLRANPVLMPFGPYTTMAAAAVYMPTKWLTIATGINDNDPDGAVTMTGFNTAFHGRNWYSVGQEYDFTILDPDNRIALPTLGTFALIGRGPLGRLARLTGASRLLGEPDTVADDWVVYYNFDQFVFTEADDPTQGIGLFGRVGYSSGKANPIEQFYSFGVGGKGVVPERDNDTCGLGYYNVNLSDDLPAILGVHSEQGVELFYNIEVTPWFHLTPDLQFIVNPGGGFQDRDVAVVYGVRGQMSF